MKIKKYTAQTMPEIMKKIRQDLGPEAIILNSREIKIKGFLGFFKKNALEVVAALDSDPIPSKKDVVGQHESELKAFDFPIKENVMELEKAEATQDIYREIKQLRELFELQGQSIKQTDFSPKYKHLYHTLLNQELDETIAYKLVKNTQANLNQETEPSADILYETFRSELKSMLKNIPFEPISYDKQVVHFVGPTGVGKTTTIAKIAAKSMLKNHKKVALVTADTYRIGAIEQLKTYAKILNIPVEVAYSYADYEAAIQKFSSYDLVLVDTAGRNYKDEQYINDLKENIKFTNEMDIYLVLSLTTKSSDLKEIYEMFNSIPIKSLIFTKLDETNTYGNLLNIPLRDKIGVSYLTVGQDVPDDIIVPNIQTLCDYIMESF